jgi:prephenate dehydrogenase
MKICNKISIVGMGLLGGSIGKALIERKLADEVVGIVRRAEAVREVKRAGAAHRVTLDVAEGVAGADIVILGVPVDQMEKLSRRIAASVRRDAVITDVGSVKGCVVAKLEKIFHARGSFVGSHPMAGKEKGGIAHADPRLFEGAIAIVTATKRTSMPAVRTVTALWEKIGARVVQLSVADHDKAVAAVSHLPHMLAVSLMQAVAGMRKGRFDPFQCIGPSFKDMTRVVASPSEMWSGILVENKREVLAAVKRFSAELGRMAAAVRKNDLRGIERLFTNARAEKEQHNHTSR